MTSIWLHSMSKRCRRWDRKFESYKIVAFQSLFLSFFPSFFAWSFYWTREQALTIFKRVLFIAGHEPLVNAQVKLPADGLSISSHIMMMRGLSLSWLVCSCGIVVIYFSEMFQKHVINVLFWIKMIYTEPILAFWTTWDVSPAAWFYLTASGMSVSLCLNIAWPPQWVNHY